MRFYLNLPLILGYVCMATTACLGMLQYAAARGGYYGLALFAADRSKGGRIGIGLTAGALLLYVLFAPEILTPGPAGTEVAEIFGLCALFALGVTLIGADLRLKRTSRWEVKDGETILLGSLPATLYLPSPFLNDHHQAEPERVPSVVLLPDPTRFVVAPAALISELCRAGVSVLALSEQGLAESDAPLSRQTLLAHVSMALTRLAQQPGVNQECIGLLGLGLGGDVALLAAATDTKIKAAVAVSPVIEAPLDPDAAIPGLHWLRELSFRQIWRWRHRWPAIRRAAADLGTLEPMQMKKTLRVSVAALCANEDVMTIRSEICDIKLLGVPSHRHFTLLVDSDARHLLVKWLEDELKHPEKASRTANHVA